MDDLKLDVFIENFSKLINSTLLILEKQKKILLQYILKISDYPSANLSMDSSNELIEFLSRLKEKIVLVDGNISKAHDFINKLKNLNNTENLDIFFDEYINISSNISNCIIDIEDFFINYMNFINLNFDAQISPELKSINVIDEPIVDLDHNNESSIEDVNSPNSDLPDNNPVENTLILSGSKDSSLIENTLIISETQGKVVLPYTIDSLNVILKENPKYQNINEVIENEFVIPYANFKNPIFSRFKEAFKLVKYKEHGSIKDAFDLGMELLLNYNLHPAIISACKNIDELDIYLDYLENNETDKFDCFDIKFEIPLSIKK